MSSVRASVQHHRIGTHVHAIVRSERSHFCCAVRTDRSSAIGIRLRSRVRIAEQIHGGAPSFAQPVGTFRIIQFPDAKSAKRRDAKSFSKIRNNSANTPKSPPNPYSLNSAKNATSKRPVTPAARLNTRPNLQTTSHQPGGSRPIRLRIGAKCSGILPTLAGPAPCLPSLPLVDFGRGRSRALGEGCGILPPVLPASMLGSLRVVFGFLPTTPLRSRRPVSADVASVRSPFAKPHFAFPALPSLRPGERGVGLASLAFLARVRRVASCHRA